ncbi:MAG: DNA translocase FtsK 4TM domain-containing protein, partial [Acidimicrobiales bacterium]
MSRLLGRQADDVWGLAILVLAVLSALAIYSDLAGPVGRAYGRGATDALGWARVLLPPALAFLGWTLVRGSARHRNWSWSPRPGEGPAPASARTRRPTPPDDPAGDKVARPPTRAAFGGALLLVAAAGVLHDIRGPVHWHGALSQVRPAGGVVGAGIAIPLRAGIGPWGSGLVLAALVVLALLILTSTPLRDAAHASVAGLATAARLARTAVGKAVGAAGG